MKEVSMLSSAVMENPKISHSTFRVYGILVMLADDRGRCRATEARIAERSGKSVRTIRKAIAKLLSEGVLRRGEGYLAMEQPGIPWEKA